MMWYHRKTRTQKRATFVVLTSVFLGLALYTLLLIWLFNLFVPFVVMRANTAAKPKGLNSAEQTVLVHSAKDIVDSFTAQGQPITKLADYTPETDPNRLLGRRGQYIQKVNWSDSQLDEDAELVSAGTIEVFRSPEEAQARYDYIVRITDELPITKTHNLLSGVYMMRLSTGFSPAQLEQYEMLFYRMVRQAEQSQATP